MTETQVSIRVNWFVSYLLSYHHYSIFILASHRCYVPTATVHTKK